MNDTPTPRTDAVTDHRWSTPYDKAEAIQTHARQLERELAEATRRLNEFEHPRDPIDQPKTP